MKCSNKWHSTTAKDWPGKFYPRSCPECQSYCDPEEVAQSHGKEDDHAKKKYLFKLGNMAGNHYQEALNLCGKEELDEEAVYEILSDRTHYTQETSKELAREICQRFRRKKLSEEK